MLISLHALPSFLLVVRSGNIELHNVGEEHQEAHQHVETHNADLSQPAESYEDIQVHQE